ncbi:MAG: hypothetical protein OSJ71_13495 [Acetatifactor sp.]|nr:hypothetical protein [Acetatifactor sp.]
MDKYLACGEKTPQTQLQKKMEKGDVYPHFYKKYPHFPTAEAAEKMWIWWITIFQ